MLSWMAVLFASLLGIDVMIKQQVEENIEQGEERELAGGRIVIRKVYNRGFLLNILDGNPKVVKTVTIGAGIGILIWDVLTFITLSDVCRMVSRVMYIPSAWTDRLRQCVSARVSRNSCSGRQTGRIRLCIKKRKYLKKLGLTLISAGAASNIFDRLARGKVIDYIGIRTGKKRIDRLTANLGDIYIACGGLILMIRGSLVMICRAVLAIRGNGRIP